MAAAARSPLARGQVDQDTDPKAGSDPCSDVVATLLSWTEDEIDALAELGSVLSPCVSELGRLWAESLGTHVAGGYGPGPQPVEALAQVNAWLLEGLLLGLRERQLAAVFQATLDYDLALLRSQDEPDLRSPLAQLYLSLEVCTSLVLRRTRELCAGNPRLPLMLAAYSRLALQFGSIVGQAFYQVRSEEIHESLRVTASLLETSRELNTRAASLDGVLLQLTQIVNRLVRCDKHLIFLWDESESSYLLRTGSGFPPGELARLQGLRFVADALQSAAGIEGGAVGTVGDGCVLLAAFGARSHAAAEMTGPGGSPLGALVAFRHDNTPFSGSERRILRGVAQNAALAIANALLLAQLDQQARLREQASGAARDAERLRLGRELHDGVLQDLSAVKLGLETALKRGTVASLPSVLDAVLRTMHEVRRVVDDLRPADLSAASLREAIAGYARVVASGRDVELDLDLPETIAVPEWAARDIYRIAQEAVANAIRHAGPTTIEIRWLRDGRQVIFSVRDNGTGFCLDEAVLGGGVLGMRERAAAIGANLAIVTAPGAGTLVRLAIPGARTQATDKLAAEPKGRG